MADAFDLSALQAAAAEGTAGLRRYREAQTALADSTKGATNDLLAGIAARSGTGPSGQAYTQQALAEALSRGSTAIGAAGDVAGMRQTVAGAQEPYLNTLHSAENAHAADLAKQIADASNLTLSRSQQMFDSDLSYKGAEDDKQLAAQRAALDALIANQGKAFSEAQDLAKQKSATAASVQEAQDRAKYGGYLSASQQEDAAKGQGVLIQQLVQAALAKQQQDAQFQQNQADMAYAARVQRDQRAAQQDNAAGAFGAIKGMEQYLPPQTDPRGRLTGLGLQLAAAQDAEAKNHTLDAYDRTQAAQQAFDAEKAAMPQRAAAADQRQQRGILDAQTYQGQTDSTQAALAQLAALANTPQSTYSQAGAVNVGLPPEVALGMFPNPTPADQLASMKTQRDLSSFGQTGMTYDEQQAAALRAATQATKDQASQLDSTISDATGGWDPQDLANLSGLSKPTIAKLVTAADWAGSGAPGDSGIQDIISLAIDRVMADDARGMVSLQQLLEGNDLSSQQKRLVRAQVRSATGIDLLKQSA